MGHWLCILGLWNLAGEWIRVCPLRNSVDRLLGPCDGLRVPLGRLGDGRLACRFLLDRSHRLGSAEIGVDQRLGFGDFSEVFSPEVDFSSPLFGFSWGGDGCVDLLTWDWENVGLTLGIADFL